MSEPTSSRWSQRLITLAVVALALAAAFGLGRGCASDGPTDAAEGEAPASMPSGDPAEHEQATQAVEYVCPMHPHIRQPNPGRCPICHMDLVAMTPSDAASGDLAVLRLSDVAREVANVQLAPVERVPLVQELTVFGHLATDQTSEAVVTAWTAGRLERLYVEAVGTRVHRGQRLARIYSPQLVIAQETLLHGLESLQGAHGDGAPARAHAAGAAVAAARTELRLLGLAEDQIDAIVESGEASETVDIRAPASGTVMQRLASEGDWVEVGSPIIALADLGEVWAELEVYERDLSLVREGLPVTVRVPGGSEAAYEARVDFVEPVFDRERRVARARVVLANTTGELRPDMFVEATLQVPVGGAEPPLSVPASAVLWTGRRSLVYVYDTTLDPPGYSPVEVELGARVGDRYVIESGLWLGERVVSSGAFRLDASLQIRGARTMMSPGGQGAGGHVH